MKTLIAAVLVLASLNSFAAKIDILEKTDFNTTNVDGAFGINEKLGRAWVEITMDNRVSPDDNGPDFDRVKVEGLSLVGGSVVLNIDGQQVECAKVRPVGIFRYRATKPTGNCEFTTRVEKRTIDNGFETYQTKVLVVSLETK